MQHIKMKRLFIKLLTPNMMSAVICWCMVLWFKLIPVDLSYPKSLIRGLTMGNHLVDGYFFLNILCLMAFLFTVLTIISIYYFIKSDDEETK